MNECEGWSLNFIELAGANPYGPRVQAQRERSGEVKTHADAYSWSARRVRQHVSASQSFDVM